MGDWIVMHRVYIDQTRHITMDKRIGKLSTQCRLSSTEAVIRNDVRLSRHSKVAVYRILH